MYVEVHHGMTDSQLRAVLEDFGADPCLICGGPPFKVLTWFASRGVREMMGSPPGVYGVVKFQVCQSCFDKGGADVARDLIYKSVIDYAITRGLPVPEF